MRSRKLAILAGVLLSASLATGGYAFALPEGGTLLSLISEADETGTRSSYAIPAMAVSETNDRAPVIPSDAAGALSLPDTWDCEMYVQEYRAWLDNGNAPEDWKYAGKIYTNIKTGAQYGWNDWIDWVNVNGCVSNKFEKPELLALGGPSLPSLLVSGTVSAATVTAAVAEAAASETVAPKFDSPG